MSEQAPKTKRILLNGQYLGDLVETGNAKVDVEAATQLIKDKGLYCESSRAKAMFDQAAAFGHTAADIHQAGIVQGRRRTLAFVPFIVNSSFGIELYIKTLGYMHGVDLHGHRLSRLFASLPDAARAHIDAVAPEAAARARLEGDIRIEQCVAGLSDAFVQWRYSYEHAWIDKFEINHALFLIEALHLACVRCGENEQKRNPA